MTAIVLAAGKSRRMGAEVPKVLIPVEGRPVLAWILDTIRAAGIERTVVVVGTLRVMVEQEFRGQDLQFAIQEHQKGTADAALACRGMIDDDELCVLLVGDAPLITSATLKRLVEAYHRTGADVAVLTARLEDPTGYGRILRAGKETVAMIIEERDASDEVKRVREVNSGMYVFRWGRLLPALERIRPSAATGELYLTDAVRDVASEGGKVIPVLTEDPCEIIGANTPEQLTEIAGILKRRSQSGDE